MESKEYHEVITDKKEIEALNKFKANLKLIIDKKDKPFINPLVLSDDDTLILFLRARKLNINKATTMISDCFQWKENIKLEDIYLNYEFKEKYRLQLLFPHGFHKLTKKGYPIYLHVMGHFIPEEFYKITTPEELPKYAVKVIENTIREKFKICSQLKGSYIYGIFGLADFKGINSSILSKKFMAYAKAILKLQDYYPEILEGCCVINAGLLFRAFYSACKIFIDSKTRKKIKVYGAKYQQGLLEFIDKENLPKFYGGECECPGGCLFSNAGPWKRPNEVEEIIPEDILKRRQEINHIMATGKLQVSADDQVKDGVETEDL
jgi:hypothetical protein